MIVTISCQPANGNSSKSTNHVCYWYSHQFRSEPGRHIWTPWLPETCPRSSFSRVCGNNANPSQVILQMLNKKYAFHQLSLVISASVFPQPLWLPCVHDLQCTRWHRESPDLREIQTTFSDQRVNNAVHDGHQGQDEDGVHSLSETDVVENTEWE